MKEVLTPELQAWSEKYPEKFVSLDAALGSIRRGCEIFIHSACGEPRFLTSSLMDYVESHPKAFYDAEVMHLWSQNSRDAGERFQANFRTNCFFVNSAVQDALSRGLADYTPLSLSQIPAALRRGFLDVDVALIQTSLPDEKGRLSLGVSVDITLAAVRRAEVVIAQINRFMPRVEGDAWVTMEEITYLVPRDEPLLEFSPWPGDEVSDRIGRYAARLVRDGDTLQVGYGALPDAVLIHLSSKKDLGLHSGIISDGLVRLIREGVISNSRKSRDRGLSVASICLGSRESFDFINNNPSIAFHPSDYTNNPLIIAAQENMLSLNQVERIDLTGQASVDAGYGSHGGLGGQADFMRGTSLSPGGTSVVLLSSATPDGMTSHIVPSFPEGAGVAMMRCDAEYVVTEYGIAFLHGRSVRERAMALIAVAHPDHRARLLEEAKRLGMIYRDQAFVPGQKGRYPEELECEREMKGGGKVLLRPVRVSDEEPVKDFFYSLSDKSMERRFISSRKDMHHDRLQNFVVIDYSEEMIILAVLQEEDEVEMVVGLGEYRLDQSGQYAEVAFAVRDTYQGRGLGGVLLSYLTQIAVRAGLQGFTAEVLVENKSMLRLFEKMNAEIEKKMSEGTYELIMRFLRA